MSSSALAASRDGNEPQRGDGLGALARGQCRRLCALRERVHGGVRRQAPDQVGVSTPATSRHRPAPAISATRVQLRFLAGGADAPGFEIAAILAVVTLGQLHQHVARLLEQARRATTARPRVAPPATDRLPASPHASCATPAWRNARYAATRSLRIACVEQASRHAPCPRAQPRQQPHRARTDVGILVGQQFLHGRNGRRATRGQPIEAQHPRH